MKGIIDRGQGLVCDAQASDCSKYIDSENEDMEREEEKFPTMIPDISDYSCLCWGVSGKERPECPLLTSLNLALNLHSVYECIVQGVNKPSTLFLSLLRHKPRLVIPKFRAISSLLISKVTIDPYYFINVPFAFKVNYDDSVIKVR